MSKRIVVNAKGIEYNYTYDNSVPDDLDVRHCHDTYEILFVVSGTGKYVVEGSTFNIRPATLMIIRPFEFHCVQLDPGVPYERYVIKFSPQSLIDEIELDGKFGRKRLFTVMIKYIAPVCIVLILVSSFLDLFGIMKI